MITCEGSQDQQTEAPVDSVADRPGMPPSQTISIPAYGAALYRAGGFEDPIRQLEEQLKLRNGAEEPIYWPFLAMAHYRPGHRDEARHWLDRLRNRQPSINPNKSWDKRAFA